jgi:hypothetical protein
MSRNLRPVHAFIFTFSPSGFLNLTGGNKSEFLPQIGIPSLQGTSKTFIPLGCDFFSDTSYIKENYKLLKSIVQSINLEYQKVLRAYSNKPSRRQSGRRMSTVNEDMFDTQIIKGLNLS